MFAYAPPLTPGPGRTLRDRWPRGANTSRSQRGAAPGRSRLSYRQGYGASNALATSESVLFCVCGTFHRPGTIIERCFVVGVGFRVVQRR
jgi:hypothetical protein